jgi:hypothetical protein
MRACRSGIKSVVLGALGMILTVIVDNMAGAGSLKLSPANSSSIRAWSPHSKTSSTIESYARHG